MVHPDWLGYVLLCQCDDIRRIIKYNTLDLPELATSITVNELMSYLCFNSHNMHNPLHMFDVVHTDSTVV